MAEKSRLERDNADLQAAINKREQQANRIRARQAEAEDVEAALTELDQEQQNGDLDARLKAAGIDNGASDGEKVLARLKAAQPQRGQPDNNQSQL